MGPKTASKKILVVDDSPTVMETLVLILRAFGFQAQGKLSAADALKTAESHRPDILLCDINLGGTSGLELSLDILKLLPDCRVILLSGDTTSAKILSDARERGLHIEILQKPMLPQELLAILGSS